MEMEDYLKKKINTNEGIIATTLLENVAVALELGY
jgi:hypothetical protein